jgi:DNA-binding Lrp family transcriptional regulator
MIKKFEQFNESLRDKMVGVDTKELEEYNKFLDDLIDKFVKKGDFSSHRTATMFVMDPYTQHIIKEDGNMDVDEVYDYISNDILDEYLDSVKDDPTKIL